MIREFWQPTFGPQGTIAEDLLVIHLDFVRQEFRRASTGELIGELDMTEHGGFVPRFSPDGRRLVFGSQTGGAFVIGIDAVLAGAAVEDAIVLNPTVEGGPTHFTTASGDDLITTHSGEIIRFWDIDDGTESLSIPVDIGTNRGTTAVTSDGRFLFHTERNGVLVRTPLDVDELVELADRRVQRAFTEDECERFALGEGCAAQS